MDEPSTSPSLICGIKAGSSQAWQRLDRLYRPLLQSWFRQWNVGAEDAEDLCQETLQAASKGIAEFHHDTFRGWLRTIAKSKRVDLIRRKRLDSPEGISDYVRQLEAASIDQSDDEISKEKADLYVRALELLRSAGFRKSTLHAFWLTVMESYTAEDAGEQLSMSAAAVRNAKYKVLKRLRQELGDAE